MDDESRKATILKLARDAVRAALEGKRLKRPDDCPGYLLEPRGCFVTLHRGEQLRGCIGTFEARHPLVDAIIEMAGAVTRDPRFAADRVTPAELDALALEVSILTPRQPLDDPLDLRIGIDGIYIIDESHVPPRSGCFLPQVAVEQGWDAAETLSFCCAHKMGLAHDAWRHGQHIKFFRFQSEVLSEER